MIKKIFVPLFLFISIATFAQNKNDNEIVAEGGAKIKVTPDIAIIGLTIGKTDTVEKKAINSLNKEISVLTKSLEQLGFTTSHITISDFKISSNQREDKPKEYTASNSLKIEFNLDRKLVDAFYKKVQENNLNDLDIEFNTKISDSLEKITRKGLVKQAIEDAKNNAENIALALNVKVGIVKQVTKGSEAVTVDKSAIGIVKFESPRIVKDVAFKYDTSFDKYEMQKVELEERITIIFSIKEN